MLDVVRDLVDLEREEQGLGLEIARLQDEQHPAGQAVMPTGHHAFLRREGEIVDTLVVREPGPTIELLDLGVFENRDAVLVSSGHGGDLWGDSSPRGGVRNPQRSWGFPPGSWSHSMVNN